MSVEWKIGDRILNRWEIHKAFGGGGRSGIGILYAVFDHQVGHAFAAKTFQDQFLDSKTVRARFVAEAYAWSNLDSHWHIVRAHFVEIIHGKHFISLEYITGGDLSQRIVRQPLKLQDALRWAIQICHGIEHALAKGIRAHRDIKPANCPLSKEGALKITGFGLVKMFDGAERPNEETSSAAKLEKGPGALNLGLDPERRRGVWKAKASKVISGLTVGLAVMCFLNGGEPFTGRAGAIFERFPRQTPNRWPRRV
jgi:serine/threonine protein kinase